MNEEIIDPRIVEVLYGGQSSIYHCCGYCKRKGKYLTVTQMKRKECLGKQCHALDKLEDHPFWKARARKLMEKKLSHQAFNRSVNRKIAEAKGPIIDEGMNALLSEMLGYDTTELLKSIG